MIGVVAAWALRVRCVAVAGALRGGCVSVACALRATVGGAGWAVLALQFSTFQALASGDWTFRAPVWTMIFGPGYAVWYLCYP